MVLGYIIVGAVLGLPLLLGVLLRVSTTYLFFSLMAGELLARTFSNDGALAISTVFSKGSASSYAGVILLILPLLFTSVFLRKTLSKKKIFLHVIPLVATGVVCAAFVLPILPAAAKAQVLSVSVGRELLKSHELIVGVIVFLQLITLWLFNRSKDSEHSGKKHH